MGSYMQEKDRERGYYNIRCRQFNFSQVNDHHEFRRNMLFINMSEVRDWERTVFFIVAIKIKYFCLCDINDFFAKILMN